MGEQNEYAKSVRVSTTPKVNKGFQAKIILPSSTTLPGDA